MKLEQFSRGFLWGLQIGGGEGVHLIAWDVLYQMMGDCRLGSLSQVARQEALISRHMTCFLLESGSLWSSMMRASVDLGLLELIYLCP